MAAKMSFEEYYAKAKAGKIPNVSVGTKSTTPSNKIAQPRLTTQELQAINTMPMNKPIYTVNNYTAPTTDSTQNKTNNNTPSVFNPPVKADNSTVGTNAGTVGTNVGTNTANNNFEKSVTSPEKKTNQSLEKNEDIEKLSNFYNWLQENITNKYQLPNANQNMQTALGDYQQAVQNYNAPYSLENDPNYQAISDYNRRQMMQYANSRGMALSDSNLSKIEQAQALLGNDFQNAEMARRQQNIANQYNQLGMLNNMNQQNYNMDMQGLNTAMNLEQQNYNRGIDLLNREIANYGFELTPQTRSLVQISQSMTPEQRQVVSQYENNFAERMNQLNPNSQEYQMLNAARFNKILSNLASNPEVYAQYLINDYGISPTVVGNMINQAQQQNFQNELSTINQYYQDFQAEINRRSNANPNDPLIPYLKISRAEKISSMQESEMQYAEKLQKDALDLWKVTGVANEFISQALGVPVGTNTADFYDAKGRLAVSQYSAETGRLNYQLSSQNAQLNKQKFELQQNTDENVHLFLGQFLEYKNTPENAEKTYSQGLMEYLTSPALDEQGNPMLDENGNAYKVFNFMNPSDSKGLLDMLYTMGRIDKSEISFVEQLVLQNAQAQVNANN